MSRTPTSAIGRTTAGTSVRIDVAANDTDADGNLSPASANTLCSSCRAPAHGSLSDNDDGTFTYAPAAGYSGADGFVYTVDWNNNGRGGQYSGTFDGEGRLSGVTFDIDNPGSQATWFAHGFEPT